MIALFADQWLSPSIIHGLGWTLIHSIWQGIIMALAALVVLRLTRRNSSALRYNVLLVLLAVFIASVFITFNTQRHILERGATMGVGSFEMPGRTSFSILNISSPVLKRAEIFFFNFELIITKYAHVIVAIWFSIFCIQCLRLSTGLMYTHRIRHHKTRIPSSFWLSRCAELANMLGIQKKVSLMESVAVQVPVVMGFFKPLILLPVGLLANIPYSHIESILLHELAHIRRSDYLVNLLQNFVEKLFFFNPAVLWISGVIRQEREACCDDMAIGHLDSKFDYIQALVSFQEYALRSPENAMAFSGKKNGLLQRVKRIANKENGKMGSMEKTILIFGAIAAVTFAVLSAGKVADGHPAINPASAIVVVDVAAVWKNPVKDMPMFTDRRTLRRTHVTTTDDGSKKLLVVVGALAGKPVNAKLKDDTIIGISIDGRELSVDEFKNYELDVRSIIDENQKQAGIVVRQTGGIPASRTRPSGQKSVDNFQEKNTEKSERKKVSKVRSGEEDSHRQVEDILDILKAANIIRGKDGTTFKLTDRELLVNQVRQSGQLHKKLSQKYIYRSGDFYAFASSGGTTDIVRYRAD